MKTKVIKIGNSRGIRIPKTILEQSGLKSEVQLEVKNDRIIIKSASRLRENWDAAFKKMSELKDDEILDKSSLTSQSTWDREEWKW